MPTANGRMRSSRSFRRHLDKIHSIVHEDDCVYDDTSIPINETPCRCYIKGIYEIAYIAGQIAGAQKMSNILRGKRNGH